MIGLLWSVISTQKTYWQLLFSLIVYCLYTVRAAGNTSIRMPKISCGPAINIFVGISDQQHIYCWPVKLPRFKVFYLMLALWTSNKNLYWLYRSSQIFIAGPNLCVPWVNIYWSRKMNIMFIFLWLNQIYCTQIRLTAVRRNSSFSIMDNLINCGRRPHQIIGSPRPHKICS